MRRCPTREASRNGSRSHWRCGLPVSSGPDARLGASGAFKRVNTWELSEQDVPWRVEEAARCPSARSIWDWALGRITDLDKVAYHLG